MVRGASPEDVVAEMFNFASPKNIKSEKKVKVDKSFVERINSHHIKVYSKLSSFPKPFRPRDFVNSILYRRLTPTQILVFAHPSEHPSLPRFPDIVRGTTMRANLVTFIGPDLASCHVIHQIDPGGPIPRRQILARVLPYAAQRSSETMLLFSLRRRSADFDSDGEDAARLAQLFMDAVEGKGKGTSSNHIGTSG